MSSRTRAAYATLLASVLAAGVTLPASALSAQAVPPVSFQFEDHDEDCGEVAPSESETSSTVDHSQMYLAGVDQGDNETLTCTMTWTVTNDGFRHQPLEAATNMYWSQSFARDQVSYNWNLEVDGRIAARYQKASKLNDDEGFVLKRVVLLAPGEHTVKVKVGISMRKGSSGEDSSSSPEIEALRTSLDSVPLSH